MDIAGIPLRDILIGATGLVGVYVAFTLLRLAQLERRKKALADAELVPPQFGPEEDEEEENEPEASPDEEEEVELYAPSPVSPAPSLDRRWPAWTRKATEPEPEAEALPLTGFGAELARSSLEQEMRQLREEVTVLRDELTSLKTTRRVSPQYEDAMALAQRGLTAQDLADRCGISLAEAELVWALARGAKQFDEEDNHGRDPRSNHARSA